MSKEESDPIVSKGPARRWPRDRGLEVGTPVTPSDPEPSPPPRPARFRAADGPRAPAWQSLLVRAGVLAALAYHLLALVGAGAAVAPFSALLAAAVRAWAWQPLPVAGVALALRFWALRTAGRDPISAIWLAVLAWGVELVAWITIGLKTPHDLAGAHALIWMLKAEGGLLLGLFGLIAPRGARKLGETDAHYNR